MSDEVVEALMVATPPQDASHRDGLVVVGMHRSGTSAVAGSLVKLGAAAPEHLLGASEGNPRGHWESTTLISFHDRLLASAGSDWQDWRQFNPEWYATPVAQQFRDEGRHLLESEFGNSAMLMLKDPRICRFLPFWLRIFSESGISPKAVLPVRLPLEVAQSLHARDGMPLPQGLLLWLRHVLDAEMSTRDIPRAVVQWDSFLADWRTPILAMQDMLDLRWPRFSDISAAEIDGFLGRELKRERSTEEAARAHPDVHAWVMLAYEAMVGLASDPTSRQHLNTLDDIRTRFNDVSGLFGRPLAALEQQLAATRERLAELQAQSPGQEPSDGSHNGADHAERQATLTLERSLAATRSSLETRLQGLESVSATVDARYEDAQRLIEQIGIQVSQLDEQRRQTDEQLAEVSHYAGTGYSALDGRASHLESLASRVSEVLERQTSDLQDISSEAQRLLEEARSAADARADELAAIATESHRFATLIEEQRLANARHADGVQRQIESMKRELVNAADISQQVVLDIQSRLDNHSEKLEEKTGNSVLRVSDLEKAVADLGALVTAKANDLDVMHFSYQQLRNNIENIKRHPLRYAFRMIFGRGA